MKTILINTHEKVALININIINYVEAEGAYTSIYTSDFNNVKCSKNINNVSKLLNSSDIVRLSRSLIVNISNIEEIRKFNTYCIVYFKNKANIELSKNLSNRLINYLSEFYLKIDETNQSTLVA
jgi:two-component system LytT family response regulator